MPERARPGLQQRPTIDATCSKPGCTVTTTLRPGADQASRGLGWEFLGSNPRTATAYCPAHIRRRRTSRRS